MKLKGITIFEQHAEKAVLALFIVVAGTLFTMQFLNATTVEVAGEEYPPEQLGEVIRERAQAASGRLEGEFNPSEAPPAVAPADSIDVAFDVAGLEIPIWGERIAPDDPTGDDLPIERTGELIYVIAEPQAPARPTAYAEGGTVDPFVPILYPEAADLLPDEQPMDTFFISAQTTWDAAAFFEALSAVPQDETLSPLPPTWYRDKTQLVDVIVEREERGADGAWGNRITLDPLPGREGVRAMLNDETMTPARLPEVLEAEAQRRASIRRPDMFPMISGPIWMSPVAYAREHGLIDVAANDQGDDGLNEACSTLRRQALGLQGEIERLERRLDQLRNPNRDASDDTRAPGRGRVGMIDGWPEIPENWLAQRTTGPRDDGDSDADREQRARERRERQIAALEQRIQRERDRLAAICEQLGDDCDIDCDELLGLNDGEDADDEPAFVDPAVDQPLLPLAQTEGEIALWAHDLSVRPDREYRYRFSVVVVNPLYGQARQLADAQRSLADDIVIRSEPGAWSDSVRSLPETYVRVVQASDANRPAPGSTSRRRPASARLDVYRFYYGYWRSSQVDLNTGDQLLAEIELPELPLFDVEENDQGQPALSNAGEQETVDDMLEVESELVMAGVFESSNRRTTDVLFALLDGRTRLASQLDDALWDLIQRSQLAAENAQVSAPGATRQEPGGGRTPGGRSPSPGRDTTPGPSAPGRGRTPTAPTGPVTIPDRPN